jgi:hypothetical protein
MSHDEWRPHRAAVAALGPVAAPWLCGRPTGRRGPGEVSPRVTGQTVPFLAPSITESAGRPVDSDSRSIEPRVTRPSGGLHIPVTQVAP